MRVAIIDLGTNTSNLLIADVQTAGFKTIHKEKQVVKLGKSGLKKGEITPEAFQRGREAMLHYAAYLNSNPVDVIKACATSAMRDSANADEFISEIKDLTGIEIEVISGEREALLIQKGVEKSLPSSLKDYCIMDVGGGSTEFIIVKNTKVVWSKSYQLGVSRLLDWLAPSDPITVEEIHKLESVFNKELVQLKKNIATHEIDTLIGSSGSFDSIHDVLAHKNGHTTLSEKLDFSQINLSDFFSLNAEFIASTLAERLNLPGLIKMRADMMVMGSLQINYVLVENHFKSLYRSGYALKEGLLDSLDQTKILE